MYKSLLNYKTKEKGSIYWHMAINSALLRAEGGGDAPKSCLAAADGGTPS